MSRFPLLFCSFNFLLLFFLPFLSRLTLDRLNRIRDFISSLPAVATSNIINVNHSLSVHQDLLIFLCLPLFSPILFFLLWKCPAWLNNNMKCQKNKELFPWQKPSAYGRQLAAVHMVLERFQIVSLFSPCLLSLSSFLPV